MYAYGSRVSRFHDLPLHIKGLLVVSIPLIGVLAVTTAFYFVQRENEDATRWMSHTLEVRSEIQMVHTRIEEAETGVLGFLLTHDRQWLVPYREAQERVPALLDTLKAMVSDNPAQLARVQRVEDAVAMPLARLRQLTAPNTDAPAVAVSDSVLTESKKALQQAELALDQTRAEEDRLLSARRAHLRQVWARMYAIIIGGLLFIPAGAILGMVLFTTGVARRVQVLEKNAVRLAEGRPIASMGVGRDEIGKLERSLSAAASLLGDRESELRHSRDELELRVEERTRQLAQTNEALHAEVGERSRAEEELSDANQRLRAVIDASPLAIFRMDLDGIVKSWNNAAETIFGWSADEVLEKPLPTIPDDEKRAFHDILAGAARGEVLSGFHTRRVRKDGKLIDIRLWTAPLRSPAGEVRGKVGIVADITEQRKLEQQLTQSQKMEAIGRLAGGVAHDFNNVITVVSGYGNILLEAVRDDPELREAAQEVLKAADRAASLAGQLLTFSRRQVIQPKIVDLNALVSDVQRLLSRLIGEDIELKTVLRPEIGSVRADPGQLEQVLMNLAVNARDAMTAGGKLTIETGETTLDENYVRGHAGVVPGRYVMLAVSDTGSGMDRETRAHIFEPFFTTKERGKGTGLGLSTVYGIVKQHGGDIWVYSEPGKGTTFKIYLPRVGAAAENGPPAALSSEPARVAHETVLLVEDEAIVRKLIRDILSAQGYTVLESDSGQAALELTRRHQGKIDLLVTDVIMPNMSGRELAETLKSERPEMKVLYLSGYTDHVIVEHGVLAPGVEFLQKPFTPAALAQRVREVLENRARGA